MKLCKFDKFNLIAIYSGVYTFECKLCGASIKKKMDVKKRYSTLKCKCGNLRVIENLICNEDSCEVSEIRLLTYSEYKKIINR